MASDLRDESEGRGKKRASHKRDKGPDPSKLSDDSLREAALRYLDRQDASVEQLRRCLRRRVYRYGDEELRPDAHARIEALLIRFQASNILDDARFASALVQNSRRRGASLPKLRMKLLFRGLSNDQVDVAIDEIKNDEELSDEASALAYAKKRRLRERYDLNDPKERNKALSALARQGFSFEVARKVLEPE